jgi:hypothetical protein
MPETTSERLNRLAEVLCTIQAQRDRDANFAREVELAIVRSELKQLERESSK